MNTTYSAKLKRLRRIIPSIELMDPEEIAKLEARHKGKMFWVFMPDLWRERTGGSNMGQYAFPNVPAQLVSGKEFGIQRKKKKWVKFIYSEAVSRNMLFLSTNVRVKKYVYNPITRVHDLVVQKWQVKVFKDTLANMASTDTMIKQAFERIVKRGYPF